MFTVFCEDLFFGSYLVLELSLAVAWLSGLHYPMDIKPVWL